MNSQPLISVLMPAYNCEKFVRQAIDSILQQSHQNFELLIADDASSDATKKIIDSYTDIRIKAYHNQSNLGYLLTSNKLCTQAVGDYLTFQDADDYAHPLRLESLLKAFQSNPALQCVGSFVQRVDMEGNELTNIKVKTSAHEIRNDLPHRFNCIGSALMVRNNIIQEFGLFHPFFDRIGSEDLYWFGIIAATHEVYNLPEMLYYYRVNTNSVTQAAHSNPMKHLSKDFAIAGVTYYQQTGKILFDSPYRVNVIKHYLMGKYWCWKGHVKKGIAAIIVSLLMNPFGSKERYQLLKIYIPKLLK